MTLFGMGKKKEEGEVRSVTPVDEILRMRQQGLTNNQIVQALQRNGYKTHQIFDGMNQADLRSAAPIEGAIEPGLAEQPQPQDDVLPEMEGAAEDMEPARAYPQQQQNPGLDSQVEEVAEAIIEEKWEDLMKDFNKVLEWKEEMNKRLSMLEQGFSDLKSEFDKLQKGVFGKVAEYDANIRSVGTDVKAMESVFQKILPALTENVNELSRLTRKAKSKK